MFKLPTNPKLLGREYYQGAPKELLLLFGPLGLHVSAGILKRLLSPHPPRPLRSLLSSAGYAALALLPAHIIIHRLLPTDPEPPIYSIGPAQLDFSFVQHALQKFPTRSLLMYGGLAGAAILHMLEGTSLLYDTYGAQNGEAKRWEKSRVRTRKIVGSVASLAIIGGLYTLWSEPISMPLPSLLARFDAILSKSVMYRL